MHKNACRIALALSLTIPSAWADRPDLDVAKHDPSRQMQLAEQKLRLIHTLINTPTIKSADQSGSAEATAWISVSKTLLGQAEESMRQSDPDKAIEKLDEALRSLSKASGNLASSRNAGLVAKQKKFEDLARQLASYRLALEDMVASPKTSLSARDLLAKLAQLEVRGQELAEMKQFEEANMRMEEAYKLAVSEISRIREGQEVVLALTFNSPREEFDYEQKRYHSNQILVGMLMREGRAQGTTRVLVDGFVSTAEKMKAEASAKVVSSDYKSAISDMEAANQQLNRALQSMGVPVF